MHGWGFGMGFGWLIPLLSILALFYFFNDSRRNYDNEESARDILDRRFANGEIDEEEYKRKKEQLKH
ncbi:SHOCT domain-containing protein [Sulfurimonas paralvinellae]|uniref:SHOCT domain-containing protein n=1 Tax=Sulfurimonas paralvinellae TaxID=317658 RepID=A0A7M1BA23_9BACT|nr:SHOCT domain-containing protein [Sulfurimonas paralvinellae]QOP46577.1 SHOCT domain-containing protein [Sulfurimonas paralvinellae]